jgi:hypothetical protein
VPKAKLRRSGADQYATIAVHAKVGRTIEATTMARASVLLVGLDPDIVDYTKSPVPGLTAAKVHAAVEADSAKLQTLGYSVKSLYVDDGKTAEAVLTDALTASRYDYIMIGAGLRVVPPYFRLFEKLINVVHRHAPASTKLCFNSNPTDTAEAVKRWV